MKQPEYTMFVGTYAGSDEPGIHTYRLNTATGEMVPLCTTTGILNPSYLEPDVRRHRLLAVSEAIDTPGHLVVYEMGVTTEPLRELSAESTTGAAPCYVETDKSGTFAVVTNYSGGSIALFSVTDEGKLGLLQTIQHEGHSVNEARQAGPHPHSAMFGPSGEYVYVQDLGTDEVTIYRLDVESRQLKLTATVSTQQGAGPRHIVFHPTLNYAYLVHELDSTITVFEVDEATGGLTQVENVPGLPQDFDGTSFAADIHVSPDGRHLYASNRGHDSIGVYQIDLETGKLHLNGFVSTQGEYPRNFAITPDGRILIAANQLSDTMVTYFIDPETGWPTATGHMAVVSRPVCIRLISE